MKRKFERPYRAEWEQDPLLSSWISRSKEDPDVAFCKACNSANHRVKQFFKISPLEEEVKKAELNVCAMLVEHNLPFRLMDHLSDIFAKCVHDSEIAKAFSCKRTKAAAILADFLAVSGRFSILEMVTLFKIDIVFRN
ncbi:hypothetical protein ACJJTC_011064 [Scirpophaga incertulas]